MLLRPFELFAFLIALGLAGPAVSQDLRVASFNVESGGAVPEVVDDLIAATNGVDIWGFSEVQNEAWATLFETAAEDGESANFERILGTTGAADRLVIVYDADRLELRDSFELDDINVGGRVRAPLVARFRIAGSTTEFLFMVNHLYRSRAARRHEQSQLLNAWARAQTLPIIALGDYNYDWSVPYGDTDHDAGYDLLTADGVFVWVRPATLIRTHCSHHNSVLDFVFVAGEARLWDGTAEILPADPSYCPDDNTTSDHRMVLAAFDLSGGNGGLRAQLLQRVTAIETELEELRRMVEGMQ
jgi:hypothetical protein